MWNPVRHVEEELEQSRSLVGKLKVAVFYLYVWGFLVGVNLYQMFVPLSFGFQCFHLDGMDKFAFDAVDYLLRIWAFYIVAWALFIENGGTKISNLWFMAMVLVGEAVIAKISIPSDAVEVFEGCTESLDTFMFPGWFEPGVPLLILVLAYIEKKVDRNDTYEQPEEQV